MGQSCSRCRLCKCRRRQLRFLQVLQERVLTRRGSRGPRRGSRRIPGAATRTTTRCAPAPAVASIIPEHPTTARYSCRGAPAGGKRACRGIMRRSGLNSSKSRSPMRGRELVTTGTPHPARGAGHPREGGLHPLLLDAPPRQGGQPTGAETAEPAQLQTEGTRIFKGRAGE